jgi:UDP-N-acetylmuramoyl-tripeptide--D-alanyl-D-alanine ligase
MEFFGTLEAVAQEELSISQFCQTLLVSSEMIDASYLASYTDGKASDYSHTLALENIRTKLLGKHSRLVLQAAASAARHFGMDASATRKALAAIEPVPGRMRLLAGKRASSIIDDSYNASPDSTVAALDTLAETPASQRIALLGSMNELGDTSAEAHAKVGAHCQPNFLNLLITLGTEANQYLALAARLNGCRVVETSSPYEAAQIILDNLAADAAILAKGSQNGVFAEEAVKQLLANPSDASKLVRQSPYWLARKQRAFADYPD